ncbi:tetratricopeptide repeat protein [Clostridiales bacterium oral taxon 876 str. F0540]|nr:tetratricopeptide repeat protein [Clostridiales bacterium oral taxon 876 str. F0540]
MIDIKKIKDALSKDKLPKFNIHRKIISNINKRNISHLMEKIKKHLTKENIEEKLKSFKVKYKENAKAYTAFLVLGIIIVVSFGISLNNNRKKAIAEDLSKKYAITTNQAEDYYYSGQYDKAIQEYNKLIEKDAKEGLWNARIAEIYSIKGDVQKSNEQLQKAKELGSKNSQVLNSVIFTEFMNKDYKTALSYGEEALKLFPKDKGIIKTMFTVYMSNNMMDKAKELISIYPVDTKSAYDTAEYSRMLMIDGQWEQGYKELRSAWDIDKDEYKIYDILAQMSVYNKDSLLESISAMSEKNPNDLAYKMWLAKIYSLSDATADQAISLIDSLKQFNLGKIEINLIEASALQNLKKNDKSDQLIKKVIDENKDDYRVLHTAGWYYLNKMNFSNAEKYCRESIIKNKNYPDNYGFLMPEILKAQGKTIEAEPYFRTAMAMEPYNYNIMLTVANYYWYTTKNIDKAMENFKIAEFVKPDEPEIKYNMALIDLSNKKYDEAVNLLKQCIKLSDSTAKYHRTLGTVYLQNKKAEDAIKEIRYAYAADQDDIMTLNNAGCYYISQDTNLEKGEYNLRKAQEGITDSTDKYTADTIRSNYKKAKDLLDKYNSGSGNETLKMPDFVLFY